MATTKLFGKDLKAYEDIDIDELLEKLTPEELEELNNDIDPDNSLLPPSQRMKDQTTKAPTGPFDREKLLKFLEKKAKEEKDWEQNKPYTKETRGKVYVPKEPKKTEADLEIETEFDDILQNATEEELVDLAAVLGFHGMLNQVQYHASMDDKKIEGGFKGMAKSTALKLVPDQPPNDTDVEASLEQLRNNDPKLKDLNLNNMKNISVERLIEIAKTLETNTKLESLQMANTASTDKVGKAIAEGMEKNKTLKVLNLESNYLSGEVIVEIIKAVNKNQKLLELRFENQEKAMLGNPAEMEIAKAIEENKILIKFGLALDFANARIRVADQIEKNIDQYRKDRIGDK